MWYAFNLISIIIVKLLIDLFIFQLTELHCSFHQNVCKNFQEINYSFSFLKNWSYIIQFWENTEITSQEVAEINVCFYFILSSHILQSTADTWLTSHNLSELHEYACDLYQTHEYSEISVSFQCQFNCFLNASLSKAIDRAGAEKMLHELKKMQEHAKWQSETRRVIVKDEVLTRNEEAECIMSRYMRLNMHDVSLYLKIREKILERHSCINWTFWLH